METQVAPLGRFDGAPVVHCTDTGHSLIGTYDEENIGVTTQDFLKFFGPGEGLADIDSIAKEVCASAVSADDADRPNPHHPPGIWSDGVTKFRRIIWPLFLGLSSSTASGPVRLGINPAECRSLPAASLSSSTVSGTATWSTDVKAYRDTYTSLLARNCSNKADSLKALDPQTCHPLSNAVTNPWRQQEKNEELMTEITQDVERTFPERALFQDARLQSSLSRILFIWSRENADVSYKQGMNELLAVVYLVCCRDQLDANWLCSPDHIEADAYTIFSRIMKLGMSAMFAPAQPTNRTAIRKDTMSTIGNVGPLTGAVPSTLSPVLTRCNYIYHVLLRNSDPAVYSHLTSLGVEPQLFLLRWVRLMFSREFHVDDILVIWDIIFADVYLRTSYNVTLPKTTDSKQIGRSASTMMPLMDYFAIAMLKFVRSNLLELDMSGCLRRLLKFPPVESVKPLAQVATSIRNRKPHTTSNTGETSTEFNKTLCSGQLGQRSITDFCPTAKQALPVCGSPKLKLTTPPETHGSCGSDSGNVIRGSYQEKSEKTSIDSQCSAENGGAESTARRPNVETKQRQRPGHIPPVGKNVFSSGFMPPLDTEQISYQITRWIETLESATAELKGEECHIRAVRSVCLEMEKFKERLNGNCHE